MKWSICINSRPDREVALNRITGILQRQIASKDVELVVHVEEAPSQLGRLRQVCLDRATGHYVNFIDDDDLVAHDYIDTIYPLLDGVDYIGYRVQLYADGAKQKPTFHSLRYSEWYEDTQGFYRGVEQKNPIRTELSRQVGYEGGYGEDHRWAERVGNLARTEHYIDRAMYFYFWSSTQSVSVH